MQTTTNNADSNSYADDEYCIMLSVISIPALMLVVRRKSSRHFSTIEVL